MANLEVDVSFCIFYRWNIGLLKSFPCIIVIISFMSSEGEIKLLDYKKKWEKIFRPFTWNNQDTVF